MASQPVLPQTPRAPVTASGLAVGRHQRVQMGRPLSSPCFPTGPGHLLSVPFNGLVAVGWCHLLVSKKRRGKEGLLVRFSAAPPPRHSGPPIPKGFKIA